MAMAHSPSIVPQSAVLAADERLIESVAEHIAAGRRPNEIALLVHPHDPVKRKQLRGRIWRLLYHDQRLADGLAVRSKAEFLMALVPATRALSRRAIKTGRPDAVKLLYEASGFHNPRVQHDHSGDINIRLTIPRPDREPKAIEGTAVDADVVED